jgi:hypothetical protein
MLLVPLIIHNDSKHAQKKYRLKPPKLLLIIRKDNIQAVLLLHASSDRTHDIRVCEETEERAL